MVREKEVHTRERVQIHFHECRVCHVGDEHGENTISQTSMVVVLPENFLMTDSTVPRFHGAMVPRKTQRFPDK
jgi:hypothetical protein